MPYGELNKAPTSQGNLVKPGKTLQIWENLENLNKDLWELFEMKTCPRIFSLIFKNMEI